MQRRGEEESGVGGEVICDRKVPTRVRVYKTVATPAIGLEEVEVAEEDAKTFVMSDEDEQD